MSMEQLVDLDELVLRCRDKQAKAYVREAVACYKAGAFRTCIVATWIAVVFDILNKLEELDLSGDKQARQRLDQFDNFRKNGDVEGSLRFERDILDIAKNEFELLSPLEHTDLQRLRDDRNRCAHPSMTARGEVYEPSAELARYHLRNAVLCLLQHPPVQGKAAMEQLEREVSSAYFPSNLDDALIAFANGPLARPRDALVRNFVIFLVKSTLLTSLDLGGSRRYMTALKAVRHKHHQLTETTLADRLNDIVARVPDDELQRAIYFVSELPASWEYLRTDMQQKLQRYAELVPEGRLVSLFDQMLAVEPLRQALERRLQAAKDSSIKELVKLRPCRELVAPALDLYAQSTDFSQAAARRKELVIPLIQQLEPSDLEKIFRRSCRKTNRKGRVRCHATV